MNNKTENGIPILAIPEYTHTRKAGTKLILGGQWSAERSAGYFETAGAHTFEAQQRKQHYDAIAYALGRMTPEKLAEFKEELDKFKRDLGLPDYTISD